MTASHKTQWQKRYDNYIVQSNQSNVYFRGKITVVLCLLFQKATDKELLKHITVKGFQSCTHRNNRRQRLAKQQLQFLGTMLQQKLPSP